MMQREATRPLPTRADTPISGGRQSRAGSLWPKDGAILRLMSSTTEASTPAGDPPAATERRLEVQWLGLVSYQTAWDLQNTLVRQRKAGEICDRLLLLEHPPVYTIGRKGSTEHLLGTAEEIAAIGATVVHVDRGGDITYHGPGQLVGYPILQLAGERRDAHRYLRDLEDVLIRVLEDFGLPAGRREGATGVWIEDRKIASIGVRLSSWVTNHGFALNVSPDLSHFGLIVPCGLHGISITSMSAELGRPVDFDAVRDHTIARFCELFDYSLG